MLKVKSLYLELEQVKVLNDCSLNVSKGEINVLMGPNGSGKSSLALLLAGHASYQPVSGTATFDDKDLLKKAPDERSRFGLFLAFQYPQTIAGVSVGNFIKSSLQAHSIYDPKTFRQNLISELKLHGLDPTFAGRSVNDGFSGGEKKRLELVQMHMLKPKLAILDEIDSGLDVDGLKLVVKSIKRFMNSQRSVVVITHYPKLAKLIKPDRIHIMIGGKISQNGGAELAEQIDLHGYNLPRLEKDHDFSD